VLEAVKRATGLMASVDAADIAALVGSMRDDAEFARVADKHRELKHRESELSARRSRLREGFNLSAATSTAEALQRRARALLAGQGVVEAEEARRDRLVVEIQQVTDELHVVREALELHKPILEREEARVCREIQARLRPAHRRNVKRIAQCLADLAAALDEEAALRGALTDAGVALHDLRPMPIETMRQGPRHEYTVASLWMKEARKAGLLE
jgi:hypothetical protein